MINAFIIILSITFMYNFSYAEVKILKTCTTTVPAFEDVHEAIIKKIDIFSDGKTLTSKETINGVTTDGLAEVLEMTVRDNLNTDVDSILADDLNQAEALITIAHRLTTHPYFKNKFATGVDLTKVKSVTLYNFNKNGKSWTTSIVEAKDKQGNLLGSFIGGLIVTPCN